MADDDARPSDPDQEASRSDGSVWVHCDDTEQAYLRSMDEVFGRENFVATVVWQKRTRPRTTHVTFNRPRLHPSVRASDANMVVAGRNLLPRSEEQERAVQQS